MGQVIEILKSLDSRLAKIELKLSNPNLSESLVKSHYSCAEVASLSQRFGTKPAKTFTVRLACSNGRIPEAEKSSDGYWRIPRHAVMRILSIGLPPERRQRD
ncbi:MAG: hypothetical protein WD738_22915 [Pirellulales bacterium]